MAQKPDPRTAASTTVAADERDEIIFSVAFSEQANGEIPNTFGRLNIAGGERRLNVAVTRARRKNVVFCSFDPAKLKVDGLSFDGPKHLKKFLEEAKRKLSKTDSDYTTKLNALNAAIEKHNAVLNAAKPLTEAAQARQALALRLARQGARA